MGSHRNGHVLNLSRPGLHQQDQSESKSSPYLQLTKAETEKSQRSILWVPVIFGIATFLLYTLSQGFGESTEDGKRYRLKFPTSVEEISEMVGVLSHLQANHLPYLIILFCAGYLYKQSFAIPGSAFMNLLAGALFGTVYGFPLACLLTATGATNCFLLSQTFGQSYIVRYFPDKVEMFRHKVESNRDSLFFFLLFLRLLPMCPNWVMNMVSPIVGVPIHLFFITALIGLMPYNFVCVQTGSVLSQISSLNDIFTAWTMFTMLLVALVALLPGIVIRRMHAAKQD